MGRVRSTMRSYALLGKTGEEVVELTNRKLLHFEFGATATVLCATSRPPYDQFRICSAGHPPPIIASPGQPNRPVDVAPNPPLGVRTESQPATTTVPTPPGALLVLYTDGLIERRQEVIDAGIERLCAAITPDHPQIVCRQVMRYLIGTTAPADDVALVALRRAP
jgi:serine phosphatase RsbU (regulator of sigma subunit)